MTNADIFALCKPQLGSVETNLCYLVWHWSRPNLFNPGL